MANNKKITSDDFDLMMDDIENNDTTIKDTSIRETSSSHKWDSKVKETYDLHIKVNKESMQTLITIANKLNGMDELNTDLKKLKKPTITDLLEELIDNYSYKLMD